MAIREILTVPDPRLKEVSKPVEGGVTDEHRALVNPEILPLTEDRAPYEEGCLSVPDVYEEVERATECKIRYLDYHGKQVEEVATGLFAVCIQHEMDHLEGTLFIDYLSRLKRQRAVDKVKKTMRMKSRSAA